MQVICGHGRIGGDDADHGGLLLGMIMPEPFAMPPTVNTHPS